MNLSMKCMKLDYLLLKPYLKSMLLVLLVPLLITFFTGTLFEGLSFARPRVMAMTTGYTFPWWKRTVWNASTASSQRKKAPWLLEDT